MCKKWRVSAIRSALGKGEVDSSILSGSTTPTRRVPRVSLTAPSKSLGNNRQNTTGTRQLSPCAIRAHGSTGVPPGESRAVAFLYAIKGGDLIKIGRTKDVARRLGDLQVGCPHPLRLVHSVRVSAALAVAAEGAAHKQVGEYRDGGEWFAIVADQARYALEYGVAVASGKEPPRRPSPDDLLATWRATRIKTRAEQRDEIAARREASKSTFATVREKFKARRDRAVSR